MKVSDLNASNISGHSEVTNANHTVDHGSKLLRCQDVCLVNATNQNNRAFVNSNQSLYRKQQKQGRKRLNFRHWYIADQPSSQDLFPAPKPGKRSWERGCVFQTVYLFQK